jgi:hypothetical protein
VTPWEKVNGTQGTNSSQYIGCPCLVRTKLNRVFLFSVRRSVQSAVIFEGYRSLEDQLPKMRPFQRKLAVFDQVKALIDAITHLTHRQKEEILWRTMSSRENMDHEVVWKRAKAIQRELESLAQKIKPLCAPGKKHSDTVDEFIQQQYVRISCSSG